MRSKGYSIYPLPLLELAESPSSIKALWKQKYVWFWGPMKYVTYFRYVIENARSLNVRDITTPLAFTIQGLVSALAWLTSAPIVLFCLITPLFFNNLEVIAMAYIAVFVYGPLQFAITYSYFPFLYKLGSSQYYSNLPELLLISIMSIPAIVFHSIPPYFSLASEINHNLTGKEIYKPKTE